jgi:hypothetical protein
MTIAHDNELLVRRLTAISQLQPAWRKDLGKVEPCNTASAAVNRRKAAAAVAGQNLQLCGRLVAMRPSRDISRETLGAAAAAAERYRLNCSQFRPGGGGRRGASPPRS